MAAVNVAALENDLPTSVSVLIPARRASTRLPEKLLLAETGTPVLVHTCQRAAQAFGPQAVVVCADDDALVQAAQGAGYTARLTRSDHPSGTDRIAEIATELDSEVIVNVQGDEPEIDPQQIITVAELLDQHPWAGMATLATPAGPDAAADPNQVKVLRSGARVHAFSRAAVPWDRDAGAPASDLLRHIGIYAYRREVLLGYGDLPPAALEQLEKLEQWRALAHGIGMAVAVVDEGAPGIDVRSDYDAFLSRWKQRNAEAE